MAQRFLGHILSIRVLHRQPYMIVIPVFFVLERLAHVHRSFYCLLFMSLSPENITND